MALNDIVAGLYAGVANLVGSPTSAEMVRDYFQYSKKGKTLRNVLLIGTAATVLSGCPVKTNYPPTVEASRNGSTVTVKAEDIDGVIAEMYRNGSSILGDDTNPAADVFEASYTDLPAGDYTFRAVDECGDDGTDSATVPPTADYTSIDATVALSESSVQHNHDAAAEIDATVTVNSGGYNYADWFVDDVYVGTSSEGEVYGVNVDWVGTRVLHAEFYNNLDELLDTVTVGSVEGLDTPPDDVYAVAGEGLFKDFMGADYGNNIDATDSWYTYLYFSDVNNDHGSVRFVTGSSDIDGGTVYSTLDDIGATLTETTTPGKFKLEWAPTFDDVGEYDIYFEGYDALNNVESANDTHVYLNVVDPRQ